ncbi:MAG: hypothetical protein Q8L88_15220 [Bacteroidota bacterium]|nr:hypothetical protein [Bacteroidota bacterium]
MKDLKEKLGLIKTAYWLGIIADAIWAIALLCPRIFGTLTGSPDFNPNLQFRLVMSIGGILMLGWTILLIWAVQKPIERRFVILLTALVVAGLFIVSMIGYLNGSSENLWILVKCAVLFVFMIMSYLKANNIEKAN